ncbi:hypothetical protein CJ030_MR1G020793 [Morella rubra]|uniref:Uncharacterized protein n=1 Tax=Morella rubra TaxID=262757 RepID=A0A6A1WP96_9ROSI|nr:hypothetical protein CJ030_MR1G020793 [Morella rubra]
MMACKNIRSLVMVIMMELLILFSIRSLQAKDLAHNSFQYSAQYSYNQLDHILGNSAVSRCIEKEIRACKTKWSRHRIMYNTCLVRCFEVCTIDHLLEKPLEPVVRIVRDCWDSSYKKIRLTDISHFEPLLLECYEKEIRERNSNGVHLRNTVSRCIEKEIRACKTKWSLHRIMYNTCLVRSFEVCTIDHLLEKPLDPVARIVRDCWDSSYKKIRLTDISHFGSLLLECFEKEIRERNSNGVHLRNP